VLAPQQRHRIAADVPLASLLDEPPVLDSDQPSAGETEMTLRYFRTDYVRRDAENRILGRLGEAWVCEYEQRRLHDEARRPDLARRVEWIADTRGDGAGYDVASFDADASPRLIEVKTTGLGKQFPFMVTANEVRVSERERERYYLYRVFEFSSAPRLYVLHGALSERCRLEATQYRARTR